MNYQYAYLLISLTALVVWFILFLARKDVRREMLTMSLLFGIAGLLVEPIYVKDWWNPLTITKTMVGIEDFLIGFAIGGIAAVIYAVVFRKKVLTKRLNKNEEAKQDLSFYIFGGIFALLFFGSSFILGLNALYCSLIAFIFGIMVIWIRRKDLITNSLTTGILVLLMFSIVYTIGELILPGWVRTFWYFKNVPDIIIFNLPIDDVMWYFLAGAFIGPLYEFWQEAKLSKV